MESTLKSLEDGGALRPLFEAAGAVYNKKTGLYELNGLTDITGEEMVKIYSSYNGETANDFGQKLFEAKVRTCFPIYNTWEAVNLLRTFQGSSVEVISLSLAQPVKGMQACFYNCRFLTDVIGRWAINISNENTLGKQAFQYCYKLKSIKIKPWGINNIYFNDSPLLSKDSVLYMIQQSKPSVSLKITLHPEAFALASSDSDIQAALAERDYVSLVQAPI